MLIGPPSGYRKPFSLAIRHEQRVHELRAIVGMKLSDPHRHPLSDLVKPGAYPVFAQAVDHLAVGPTSSDVGGHQRGEEEPGHTLSAVKDQIRLNGAGLNS